MKNEKSKVKNENQKLSNIKYQVKIWTYEAKSSFLEKEWKNIY